MKKVASIFLILILLLQCSTKVAIVVWYHLNKDFIAANLCENKAKPKMKCEGKCQMNKKIKEQEKNESMLSNLLKHVGEGFWFYNEINLSLRSNQGFSVWAECESFYNFTYNPIFKGSIFQPPQQLS